MLPIHVIGNLINYFCPIHQPETDSTEEVVDVKKAKKVSKVDPEKENIESNEDWGNVEFGD